MDAARHELTVDVPSEPIVVTGDAVRLTQVFANLLTNAAKYTNAGGHIWLAVRKEGERAIVSVRDDGIGIPPAQLASVFDMFTQVDRSSRRSQGGLGIGLTLVRSLVTIHGGRVEARSPGPGAGSEFIVDLPILIGRRIRAHKAKSLGKFPPRRILVVDDNRDAAETLGALLSGLGATVSVADSGPAALEILKTFQPEAVLLDIGMPEMDGYEVSRRIRATPDHGRVLLIALTGWGQEDDLRRSRAAGFDHHLVKPPDVDKLRDLLTAVRRRVRSTVLTAISRVHWTGRKITWHLHQQLVGDTLRSSSSCSATFRRTARTPRTAPDLARCGRSLPRPDRLHRQPLLAVRIVDGLAFGIEHHRRAPRCCRTPATREARCDSGFQFVRTTTQASDIASARA